MYTQALESRSLGRRAFRADTGMDSPRFLRIYELLCRLMTATKGAVCRASAVVRMGSVDELKPDP